MARRITRKSLKKDEFVDAAFDFGAWIERQWRTLAAAGAAVVVVLLLFAGWRWWSSRKIAEAEHLLSEGLARTQPEEGSPTADSSARYAEALSAFEKAAHDGSGTAPGRVAVFYQAAVLQKLGRHAEGVALLEPLASGGEEDLLTDLARAKLAWAYLAAGQPDKAVASWKEIAGRTESYYPQDLALLHAAEILHRTGKGEEAKSLLEELTAKYPQGPAAEDARKLLSKLSGTAALTP